MLIIKNKRYVKRHVIGGTGIFDSAIGFIKRLVSSNAARSIATNLSNAAASDLGKSAIDAAKTVAKELATSGITAAKDVAIDRGKQLINRTLTPKNAAVIKQLTDPVLSQNSKDVLATLLADAKGHTNINKLMMGQAIRIEDLIRTGGGLRLA